MNFKKDRYLKLANEKKEMLRIYSNKGVNKYINNLYFLSVKSYFFNLVGQKNIDFSEKIKIISDVVLDIQSDCLKQLEPSVFSKVEKIYYKLICKNNKYLIFIYCSLINLLFKITNKTRF